MNLLKSFLAFFIVGLFLFACEDESNNTYKPLYTAKFDKPNNNVYYKIGTPIDVFLSFDSTQVLSFKLFLNDSLVHAAKSNNRNESVRINSSNLSFGSYVLKLEATTKSNEKKVDTRSIRILSKYKPTKWEAEVVKSYPHNPSSYTQGLEFYKGELYEGTGQYNKSKLLKVSLENGKFERQHAIEGNFFGEGITILNDKVYQLTWKEKTCFVYDVNDFTEEKRLGYGTEGWGLCNDGEYIIMSDGSQRITFRNPETFEVVKSIDVYTDEGPVGNLNELEYVDGKIFANIYGLDKVLVINSANGNVEVIIDADLLALQYREEGEVLNGIAYNAQTNKFYFTGKEWTSLLEVKFNK